MIRSNSRAWRSFYSTQFLSAQFHLDFMGELSAVVSNTPTLMRGILFANEISRGPLRGLNFETVTFGPGNPTATCLSLQKGPRTMAIVKPLLPDDTSIQKVNEGGRRGREMKGIEVATEKPISCMNWLGAGGRPSCLPVGSPPPNFASSIPPFLLPISLLSYLRRDPVTSNRSEEPDIMGTLRFVNVVSVI